MQMFANVSEALRSLLNTKPKYRKLKKTFKMSTKKEDKNLTSNDAKPVLCEVILKDLKEKFHAWSGFEMESSNLEDAQKEIEDMKDKLSNEISDYANRLDAIAKKAFRDNLA